MDSEHTAHMTGACAHPEGNRLLTFAKDNTMREFDMRTLQCVQVFKSPEFRVATTGCKGTYRLELAATELATSSVWHAFYPQHPIHFFYFCVPATASPCRLVTMHAHPL